MNSAFGTAFAIYSQFFIFEKVQAIIALYQNDIGEMEVTQKHR